MMDSSILTDKEDYDTVMTSPPPARVITVKNEYTVKDRNEMLALAQKKFDQMRQKNRERAKSSRFQRLSRSSRLSSSCSSSSKGFIHNNQERTKVNQLLSSLLYLSLMMHKVDKMKMILEHHDSNLYNEWVMLLGSLHSPVFHLKERRFQNHRVKKILSRKNRYKSQYQETRSDLDKAQETMKEMSLALSQATEEINRTSSLLHEKQNVESDFAAAAKELELYKTNITNVEGELHCCKTECSELHSKVESLQLKLENQLQTINMLELDQGEKKNQISLLKGELLVKEKQSKELECRVNSLDKEVDAYKRELKHENLLHESMKETNNKILLKSKEELKSLQALLEESKRTLVDLEGTKNNEISSLREQVGNVSKALEIKDSELKMTQNELHQAREDLNTKESSFSHTLRLFEDERKANNLLQEKHSTAVNEIDTLNLCIEKKTSETIALTQMNASLETKLKNTASEAENRFASLDKDLKSKDVKIMQTEKEISDLICTNQSLERSLSEALLSKTSAEEQKQKILDGEIKSVILSIKELAAENPRITKMMESMKNSIMQDIHNALKQQKKAEEKAQILQKDLLITEKEVAVLRCNNVSLEKSLSEVTQLKTCAEEQKQKLIESESNSVNTSIAKLTAENKRINSMMGSMKDSLMKDVHDALEQQKVAQLKVDKLQSELVKCEKEVAVLRSHNIALEQSLAEAKSQAEEESKMMREINRMSVNSSIEKLTKENERISEALVSMRESVVNDILCAISQKGNNKQTAKEESTSMSRQSSSSLVESNTANTKMEIHMNEVIASQANEVILEAMNSALDKISLGNDIKAMVL